MDADEECYPHRLDAPVLSLRKRYGRVADRYAPSLQSRPKQVVNYHTHCTLSGFLGGILWYEYLRSPSIRPPCTAYPSGTDNA